MKENEVTSAAPPETRGDVSQATTAQVHALLTLVLAAALGDIDTLIVSLPATLNQLENVGKELPLVLVSAGVALIQRDAGHYGPKEISDLLHAAADLGTKTLMEAARLQLKTDAACAEQTDPCEGCPRKEECNDPKKKN